VEEEHILILVPVVQVDQVVEEHRIQVQEKVVPQQDQHSQERLVQHQPVDGVTLVVTVQETPCMVLVVVVVPVVLEVMEHLLLLVWAVKVFNFQQHLEILTQ
tara:strand:+ start:745 stop:1050 length:306 start_codon:yes stop_codon:yes gene_type:complete